MSRAGVYWDGVYWHSREPVKSVSWPAPDPAERRWPVRFASDPYWTWMTFRPHQRFFDVRIYERYAMVWLP